MDGIVDRWKGKALGVGTVKTHSSGPEVERGRCEYLGGLVDSAWEDILHRGVAGNEIRCLNDRRLSRLLSRDLFDACLHRTGAIGWCGASREMA